MGHTRTHTNTHKLFSGHSEAASESTKQDQYVFIIQAKVNRVEMNLEYCSLK